MWILEDGKPSINRWYLLLILCNYIFPIQSCPMRIKNKRMSEWITCRYHLFIEGWISSKIHMTCYCNELRVLTLKFTSLNDLSTLSTFTSAPPHISSILLHRSYSHTSLLYFHISSPYWHLFFPFILLSPSGQRGTQYRRAVSISSQGRNDCWSSIWESTSVWVNANGWRH